MVKYFTISVHQNKQFNFNINVVKRINHSQNVEMKILIDYLQSEIKYAENNVC